MRRVVPPKLVWKYIGDESPEKQKESEERVRQVYDRIFTAVADNIRRKKLAGFGKIKKNMDDKHFLQLAVEQAIKSVNKGGFPAGAVVVKDNAVVSEGVSLGFKLNDPTSHAETASMRDACKKLKTTELSGATLYASLQPCLMCFSVANWSGISRIVFGCKKTEEMVKKGYYEGFTDIKAVNQENNRKIELVFLPDFEQEMLDLVKSWEKKQK